MAFAHEDFQILSHCKFHIEEVELFENAESEMAHVENTGILR